MRNDNADLSSQSRFCTVLDKASARNSRPQPRSGARVPYLADRYMTRATGRVSKNWRVQRRAQAPAIRPRHFVTGDTSSGRRHHRRLTRPEQVERNVAAARWLLNPGELAEVDRMTADT